MVLSAVNLLTSVSSDKFFLTAEKCVFFPLILKDKGNLGHAASLGFCSYTLKLCWLQGLFITWLISLHIFRLTERTVYTRIYICPEGGFCCCCVGSVRQATEKSPVSFVFYFLHHLSCKFCRKPPGFRPSVLRAFCRVSSFCQLFQFESAEGKSGCGR